VSTPLTDVVGSADPAAHAEDHSHGPTDKQYFKIFWVLVVLTALEVSTEWWTDWFGEGSRKVAVPVLIFLMIVKFFLVALYFMHLKFDNAMLRRIFWFGSIVAIAVYAGALTAMNFWEDSGTTRFNDPPPASSARPGGSEAEVAPGAGSGQTEVDGG
jgi:cytochrome c oxidase subunit 4